jgi:hypothetical protein
VERLRRNRSLAVEALNRYNVEAFKPKGDDDLPI